MESPGEQSPNVPPAACSWPDLPVALRRLPERGEVKPSYVPEPELSAGVLGTANCWYLTGATRRDLHTGPGLDGRHESGSTRDRMGWRGTPRERIVAAFPAAGSRTTGPRTWCRHGGTRLPAGRRMVRGMCRTGRWPSSASSRPSILPCSRMPHRAPHDSPRFSSRCCATMSWPTLQRTCAPLRC